jgi:hypothetical protein
VKGSATGTRAQPSPSFPSSFSPSSTSLDSKHEIQSVAAAGGEVVAPPRDPSPARAFPARDSAPPSSGLVSAPVGPVAPVPAHRRRAKLLGLPHSGEVSPPGRPSSLSLLVFRDLGFGVRICSPDLSVLRVGFHFSFDLHRVSSLLPRFSSNVFLNHGSAVTATF